jgi:nucleotide-binding universal stress UspA family protein
MTPFKAILAATDFSLPANNAVLRAAMLAKRHGARLHIVHVVAPARTRFRGWFSPAIDLDLKIAEARDTLHRLAADLTVRHGVMPSLEVRAGDVLKELHRVSARADLLVIGQRRTSALAEMVLGSTAQRLMESSRRHVLVVKQVPRLEYRRALVPIDFTPASDAAAVVAATLARDIELHVFHAFDSTGETVMRRADVSESVIREYRLREEETLMARMRRSMAQLGLDSHRMSFALGRGSPVKATLRQAEDLNVDVLVASRQRRGRMATSVLGTINSLLTRSRCDMLIVSGRVRDPRHPQAAAVLWQQSPAVPIGNRDGAYPSYGSSWMGAQLPADAFMAGQPDRPCGAGG